MAALGELVVSLSANTAKFNDGLSKAAYQSQKAFESMTANAKMYGKALGITAVAGATAFVYAMQRSIEVLAQLDDMAQKTGSSVENLSRLQQVATQYGQDFGAVDSALVKLAKSLAEVDDESSSASKSLRALGISQEFVKSNDTSAVFVEIAKRLQTYQDGNGKVLIGNNLMGKSFADLLPYINDVAENIDRFTGVTAQAAAQAAKFQDDIGGLKLQFDNLVMAVTSDALPALNELTNNFIENQKKAGTFLATLASIGNILKIATVGTDIEQAEKRQLELLERLTVAEKRYNETSSEGNKKANENARRNLINMRKELGEVTKFLEEKQSKAPSVEKAVLSAPKDTTEKTFKSVVDSKKKQVDDINKEEIRRLNIAIWVNEQIAMLEKTKNDEIAEMTAKRMDIEQRRANENFEEAQRIYNEKLDAEQKLVEQSKIGFEDLKNAIDGFAQDGANAMADFIFGTQGSFSDMVNSMLKDLARLALQRSIFDPLVKGITGSLGTEGFGGFLSSMFGGGRAQGGNVQGGKSYLVGEYGPEVVTMGGNGTVTPNMGGNVSVSVNVDANGGSVESNETFGKQLGNAIKATVQSELLKQKRQGGLLA